jgi:hypothetical protein
MGIPKPIVPSPTASCETTFVKLPSPAITGTDITSSKTIIDMMTAPNLKTQFILPFAMCL